ncbi:fimbria/pilus periplasmic chaperone [Shewanella sp. D64]|uniref:fimbria/pilus periplasmic chaperone n=1 Tax=unclassified Shewanella TaxID=196818 RepID=UPI0022BA6C07|nr:MULTISPECIES: fimbria/pilus periplasmic chaperone [unclassified Shewanella]MEC4728539.1 fimbria/pilus periplasmic chaperone [Shewanella sp. D64]MEC4740543.1 fimbria/pilus periplasmic chaperone [Shewanella sp. E94]WBJ94262.1 fimbria/pilus periplasmic chaperone [Shewanella sp. MTB7]
MRLFTILLPLLLLFPCVAHAFELFPMVTFFSDQGSKSEQFFQVNNTTEQPLPLEIFVKQRHLSGEKPEQLTDSDDFFVFPPQVLIPSGKTQMVKVKYIGDKTDISNSYRIVFSQLPIKDDVKESSIKMLFQIGALVFVSPSNVTNTVTASIEYQDDMPSTMLLTNQGAGVIVIPQLSFTVKSDHANHHWKWQDIQHLFNQQYLVPGEMVSVAVNSLLSVQDSSASVDIKGKR